jgi:transposase
MDWEERLDEWELELDLSARLEGSDWVTLERAAAGTGASRAALRTWYRTGQIPSRLVDGPHGPQRLVPLAVVAARAEASPRLRHTAERRLADQAQLEILRHRVDQLELRLAALEGRPEAELPNAEFHDREDFCFGIYRTNAFAIMAGAGNSALSGPPGNWPEKAGGRFLVGREPRVSGRTERRISIAGAGDERLTRCVPPATGLLYTCVLRWLS